MYCRTIEAFPSEKSIQRTQQTPISSYKIILVHTIIYCCKQFKAKKIFTKNPTMYICILY